MSSPPTEGAAELEKKAGHPPADSDFSRIKIARPPKNIQHNVKVAGGVRIVQHNKGSTDKNKDKEEVEEPGPNEERKVIVSGVPANEVKDFPTEAVKAIHQKPMPSVQKSHAPPPHHIQQPRNN